MKQTENERAVVYVLRFVKIRETHGNKHTHIELKTSTK